MAEDMPLYQRDPEAWHRHLAEGNRTQARKRVGADALVRDDRGRILLVDPKYKPDWDLPGGMAEANEPPHDAVRRELKEELDLDLPIGRMLCVDWVSPHGPWDDSLMFIFDAGVVSSEQTAAIRLIDGELASFDFHGEAEARDRLRPYVWRRTAAALLALKSNCSLYLVDGSASGWPSLDS